MTKAEYRRYLQSSHWHATRARRLALAGYRCEFTPFSYEGYQECYGERCVETQILEVHHLHYESLGAEQDRDLEVLCRFHHLVREAIGDLDCPECADGPMSYDEEDIIEQVERLIRDRGAIDNVTKEDVQEACSDCFHCSYCESR